MSLAHIKSRITASEESFEKSAFSDQSFVLTDAVTDTVEQFSLELHVGVGWALAYSPQKNQLTTIPENGVKIPGRGSVVVAVKERVKIPHNLYGIILPTGSLFLSHGILIAPAKIEPGFNGYLKLRLFNTTPNSHLIKAGDKLASAIFFSTDVTVRSREISNTGQVAGIRERWYHKFTRWISLNRVSFIGWSIAIAGWLVPIGIAVGNYYANKKVENVSATNTTQLSTDDQIKKAVDAYLLEKAKTSSAKHDQNPLHN